MQLSRFRPLIRASPFKSALASAYKPTSTRIASLSTITDAITKDQRELEEYYNEVVHSGDPDHRARYGNQLTWELARHSIAEELIVYPAMERYLGPKGKELADDDRAQHHWVFSLSLVPRTLFSKRLRGMTDFLLLQVKELLKEYQKLRGDHPEHVPKLKGLWQALSKHFVPTRSHPSAGEGPAVETVASLLATPMDKLADMFRKFPKEEDNLANWNKDARP
ncbi:HHE domain-containing protein [Apiospora phragmitis]|uniref:HHE domain-containing protein n=1 Tax=Apiospora phragmitis TaxID=2905665 RepID=A0ABR1X6M1_9PEZI